MKTKGRPKKRSKEDVLQSSMQVFWQHGYDAASIAQLCDASGLKPPSLYAEFGDKTQLFIEVLEHYHKAYHQRLAALADENIPTFDKLSAILDMSLASNTDKSFLGCLIAISATTCTQKNERISKRVQQFINLNESLIEACISNGITRKDIPAETNAKQLARYMNGVIQGAATLSRSQKDEKAVIDLISVSKQSLLSLLS